MHHISAFPVGLRFGWVFADIIESMMNPHHQIRQRVILFLIHFSGVSWSHNIFSFTGSRSHTYHVPCPVPLFRPVLRLRTDQDRPHLDSAIGLRCHLQSLVSLGTQGGNDGRTGWIRSITLYWLQWFHGGYSWSTQRLRGEHVEPNQRVFLVIGSDSCWEPLGPCLSLKFHGGQCHNVKASFVARAGRSCSTFAQLRKDARRKQVQ